MGGRFLAAAVQMTAGPEKARNLDSAEMLVREAASRGAALAVLPETFNWRGPREAEKDEAEPLDGPTATRMAALARALGIHLVAGSILERAPRGRPYNTSCLFGPDGERLAVYRKIHLFDVDLPARGVRACESATRQAGSEVVVASTPLATCGLSICYDLRFPELYRALARAGAECVTIPSAFTFPTGAAHWEPLVRARAIENQVYVVAPNQIGPTPRGYSDYGNSVIVDPWGKVLARAADRIGVIVADIDLDYLAGVRRELPCLDHVRLLA